MASWYLQDSLLILWTLEAVPAHERRMVRNSRRSAARGSQRPGGDARLRRMFPLYNQPLRLCGGGRSLLHSRLHPTNGERNRHFPGTAKFSGRFANLEGTKVGQIARFALRIHSPRRPLPNPNREFDSAEEGTAITLAARTSSRPGPTTCPAASPASRRPSGISTGCGSQDSRR